MPAKPLSPEVRHALAVLERCRIAGPEDAAEWARAALVLIEAGRHWLAEATLPAGWCLGFWPEVLRATAALARGHDPPPPLNWTPPKRPKTS